MSALFFRPRDRRHNNSSIISQIYRVALRSSTSLALNQFERRITRLGMQVWAIAASFGPLVILPMYTLPDAWLQHVGYVYLGLFFVGRLRRILDWRSKAEE